MVRRIVPPSQHSPVTAAPSSGQRTTAPRTIQPNAVGQQSVVSAYTLHQRNALRSADLVRAVLTLDTQVSPSVRRELLEWITEEYANRGGGVLLGLLAHCYLGHPYVDHTLSLDGFILEHYSAREAPPAIYQPARPLARGEHYAYIEVYDDGAIVPVREDGRS